MREEFRLQEHRSANHPVRQTLTLDLLNDHVFSLSFTSYLNDRNNSKRVLATQSIWCIELSLNASS